LTTFNTLFIVSCFANVKYCSMNFKFGAGIKLEYRFSKALYRDLNDIEFHVSSTNKCCSEHLIWQNCGIIKKIVISPKNLLQKERKLKNVESPREIRFSLLFIHTSSFILEGYREPG